MRSHWTLIIVCLLGTASGAGNAVANEPHNSRATDSRTTRGDITMQAPARKTEDWRLVYTNRIWWYWTPQNSWMVWNGTDWVHSPTVGRYSASRGSSNRSFSYHSEALDNGNAYPSQEQVNSAGDTGLGYAGLR
jgi:hypothetical protein